MTTQSALKMKSFLVFSVPLVLAAVATTAQAAPPPVVSNPAGVGVASDLSIVDATASSRADRLLCRLRGSDPAFFGPWGSSNEDQDELDFWGRRTDGRAVYLSDDNGQQAADFQESRLSIWTTASLTSASAKASNGAQSFDVSGHAFQLGSSVQWSPDLLTGLAFSYEHASVSSGQNIGKGSLDFYSLEGYGRLNLNKHWYLLLDVGAGYVTREGTRTNLSGAPVFMASSSGSGHTFNLFPEMGYEIQPWRSLILNSLGGINLTYTRLGKVKEASSPGIGVNYDADTTGALHSMLGQEASYTFFLGDGFLIRPTARAFWEHNFSPSAGSLAATTSTGAAISTPLHQTASDNIILSAALDVKFSDSGWKMLAEAKRIIALDHGLTTTEFSLGARYGW